MFVAIDPGNDTGWSIWRAGKLADCGLGDPRRSRHHVANSEAPDADVVEFVVVEVPRIYPHACARPNDVIQLALSAGKWVGLYEGLGCAAVQVTPAEWKGQLPKPVHHARVWASLDNDERDLLREAIKKVAVSRRHNVLDAVGLGKWAADHAKA